MLQLLCFEVVIAECWVNNGGIQDNLDAWLRMEYKAIRHGFSGC